MECTAQPAASGPAGCALHEICCGCFHARLWTAFATRASVARYIVLMGVRFLKWKWTSLVPSYK